jgi:hypothetical protein
VARGGLLARVSQDAYGDGFTGLVRVGPLGAGLDKTIFHKVAQATVRSLLARVADALTRPQSPASAVPFDGNRTARS